MGERTRLRRRWASAGRENRFNTAATPALHLRQVVRTPANKPERWESHTYGECHFVTFHACTAPSCLPHPEHRSTRLDSRGWDRAAKTPAFQKTKLLSLSPTSKYAFGPLDSLLAAKQQNASHDKVPLRRGMTQRKPNSSFLAAIVMKRRDFRARSMRAGLSSGMLHPRYPNASTLRRLGSNYLHSDHDDLAEPCSICACG